MIETSAGNGGRFYDGEYAALGCRILSTAQEVYDSDNVIIKIREPQIHPVTNKHEIG